MFKKKLKSNKGMTLIEVMVCVAILAIIIPSLLGLFANSARYTMVAEEIFDVGYAAQKVIEETLSVTTTLYDPSDTDHSFLAKQTTDKTTYPLETQYEYTIDMIPTGLFTTDNNVAYLYVIGRASDILIIGPDGSYDTVGYPTSGSNFTLTYTGSTVSMNIGGVIVNGNMGSAAKLIVVVNTANWTRPFTDSYNLVGAGNYAGSNLDVIICADVPDTEDTTAPPYDYTGIVVGSSLPEEIEFRGVSLYDTTLIQVEVDIYYAGSASGDPPKHSLIDKFIVPNG